jgi:hypothetical protein
LNDRRPTPAAEFAARNPLFDRINFALTASSPHARSASFTVRFRPFPKICFTRSIV